MDLRENTKKLVEYKARARVPVAEMTPEAKTTESARHYEKDYGMVSLNARHGPCHTVRNSFSRSR